MKESIVYTHKSVNNFEPLPEEVTSNFDTNEQSQYLQDLEKWVAEKNKKIMKHLEEGALLEKKEQEEKALKNSIEDLYKNDPNEPWWQK